MYHRTAKSSFRSLMSALLAVLLLAASVSTQTAPPTYPKRPVINRDDLSTNNERALAAVGANRAQRQRPFAMDIFFSEERWTEPESPTSLGARPAAPARQKVKPDSAGAGIITHWSDSFTYQKLTYKYTMVGTDPKRGSATTVIPTVIIPLRFVVDDGTVYDASTDLVDGQTAIEGIINSPIFQPQDFNIGGINVGRTQYGDAFMRAQFWDSVSRQSPDYHVLLGQPTVLPAYEAYVSQFDILSDVTDPETGATAPVFHENVLEDATSSALWEANVPPDKLAIVVWGNIFVEDDSPWDGDESDGYHGSLRFPEIAPPQTFISAPYHSRRAEGSEDINSLSRQVLNWLNDPFRDESFYTFAGDPIRDSFTPGWNYPGQAAVRCQSKIERDRLEPADVLKFTPGSSAAVDSGGYHLADGAFLDYFTRANSSRSANGQYTFFGLTNSPSARCVGHVEIEINRFVEGINPDEGRDFTIESDINNNSWVVGTYIEWVQSLRRYRNHGFLHDGSQYTLIDYPGARSTDALGLNNDGQVVGRYFDSAGQLHGFLYFEGAYTPLDFPGANYTVASAINNRGDIVGTYGSATGVIHGFVYQGGQYRTIDTPFALHTVVADINDLGQLVGTTSNEITPVGPTAVPDYGYLLERGEFTRFDFPGTPQTYPFRINNQGTQAGSFGNPFNGDAGDYVIIHGHPYEVYLDIEGLNDKGQTTVWEVSGFYVATLPK